MNPHPGTGGSADRAAKAPGDSGAEPVAEPGAAPPVLGPPETRGRTRVADRVLERIAAHAVAETAQVGGAAPRLLGVPLGRDTARTAARVSAQVDGHLAIVKVTLSVTYPAPIRRVTRRVREQVTARVSELTGLDVRQVDIDIASLPGPEEQPRRVL